MIYDLAIIGGGASGIFGAINCAEKKNSAKIIILEKSNKILSKVKISGGGRCNVTHACFENKQLIKNYPRGEKELLSEFARFTTSDSVAWFEDHGVKLKRENDGRMFPVTDNSQTVIDCLVEELQKKEIRIQFNFNVQSVKKEKEHFTVLSQSGEKIHSRYLLIACGGFPKEEQYSWLLETGHSIEKPVPSLFTFNLPGNSITDMMGVSVKEATVKLPQLKIYYTGPLLITHWGLSGPCVLKLSAYGARKLYDLDYKYTINVNWLNDLKFNEVLDVLNHCKQEHTRKMAHNHNPFNVIPERLWLYLIDKSDMREKVWADVSNKNLNKLAELLANSTFEAKGKTTYKEEFVTAGGIKLSEIEMKTMESKIVPGLFFSGEIMNIDGITGGFNFQHAWSSGFIAGTHIATLI